jgi:hypothetical protein
MQYPLQIIRVLGVTPGQTPPTGREVLEAMLELNEIDPITKARIGIVLDGLREIEPALAKPSREVKQAQKMISDLISDRPIFEQVGALREAAMRPPEPSPDWLKVVLEWIAGMFEDGAGSIYNSDHPFHRLLASDDAGGPGTISRDSVDVVKDIDYFFGVAGGSAGSTVLPAVGTAAGAALGACAGSAGAAIGAFLAWLF